MNHFEESPESRAPVSVLVVEDEVSVAKSIEMVLGEHGYRVVLASDGQSALDLIASARFDVLVADLKLPDISGMDVVTKVNAEWPQTAIIIITGYPTGDLSNELGRMGILDYLAKPFTEDELTAMVMAALDLKRGSRRGACGGKGDESVSGSGVRV